MAAEEAGVAVYQVEPLPEGQGDIGTVSVRFRDMSTDRMVERRWPIPYEASAQRMREAAAEIRIATVAALFAAKLKDDPVGEIGGLQRPRADGERTSIALSQCNPRPAAAGDDRTSPAAETITRMHPFSNTTPLIGSSITATPRMTDRDPSKSNFNYGLALKTNETDVRASTPFD